VSGAVGLEPYGAIALLRSLVVRPDGRGRGFGRLLTDTAEGLAARLGVTSMYLLTTSADAFFATRGYQRIEHSGAPQAIRTTAQFSVVSSQCGVDIEAPWRVTRISAARSTGWKRFVRPCE
jgi:N-acetylglutamate synthase-like GNAT family acetyltransferase